MEKWIERVGRTLHHLPFTIYHLPFTIPHMTEPEIARRCPSCGLSIRVRSSFCPQCGKALEPRQNQTGSPKDAAARIPDTGPVAEFNADSPGSPANVVAGPSPAVPRKPPRQATVGMLHHAGSVKREGDKDDLRPRVEKVRHISSVVLDEAAYDASLRFVLVAAVLFILFLALLLLSELIT